ncbi:hypothetical protein GCM10022226_20870 [Sphaerisporangium flaviroseum]|uniref:SIR2-like domain-containing protein n=1 Tax=Sphaerisporangium flaviroseum TaxID=509199 RepID=A0ABP7HV19_9ACTN
MPEIQEVDDDDWQRLTYQLRNGDCTPFLGAGACGTSLPTGRQLSLELAGEWDYPFADAHDLTKVTQFGTVKFGDAVYVKQLVCDRLSDAEPPDFSDPLEPHGLLAGLPLPVYLTTNYDDFIVQALTSADKKPNSAVCAWNDDIGYAHDLLDREAGWNPLPDTPLVYHLHGSLEDPRSIVITEDDYIEFMSGLILDRRNDDQRMIPPVILAALTRRALLFVGYSLQDWTFRALFTRLARTVPGINRRRHVSVQLTPASANPKNDVRKIRDLMTRHYEGWKISVFWGTAEDFCGELRRRMESS